MTPTRLELSRVARRKWKVPLRVKALETPHGRARRQRKLTRNTWLVRKLARGRNRMINDYSTSDSPKL
eukprot:6202316-Pleurochrysis_carterae.AAC.2